MDNNRRLQSLTTDFMTGSVCDNIRKLTRLKSLALLRFNVYEGRMFIAPAIACMTQLEKLTLECVERNRDNDKKDEDSDSDDEDYTDHERKSIHTTQWKFPASLTFLEFNTRANSMNVAFPCRLPALTSLYTNTLPTSILNPLIYKCPSLTRLKCRNSRVLKEDDPFDFTTHNIIYRNVWRSIGQSKDIDIEPLLMDSSESRHIRVLRLDSRWLLSKDELNKLCVGHVALQKISVYMKTTSTEEIASTLRLCPNIRVLRIDSPNFHTSKNTYLRNTNDSSTIHVPYLRDLSIPVHTDTFVSQLEAPQLERFRLTNLWHEDVDLSYFQRFTKLKQLEILIQGEVTWDKCKSNQTPTLTQLVSVRLFCPIDALVSLLRELAVHAPQCRHFEFANSNIDMILEIMSVYTSWFSNMTRLTLHGTFDVKPETTIRALDHLHSRSALQVLGVSRNSFVVHSYKPKRPSPIKIHTFEFIANIGSYQL